MGLSVSFWGFYLLGKFMLVGLPILILESMDNHPGMIASFLMPLYLVACVLLNPIHDFDFGRSIWHLSKTSSKLGRLLARGFVLLVVVVYVALAAWVANEI